MTQPCHSETAAVADLVQRYFQPRLLEVKTPEGDTTPVLVLPDGLRVHALKQHLDEYREEPERREGVATHETFDSFCNHVVRFSDEDSAIFARNDRYNPTLVSIFDYHRKGAEGSPRFGRHQSIFTLSWSEAWSLWVNAYHPIDQETFAELVETRILDVVEGDEAYEESRHIIATLGGRLASPSHLLALARGAKVECPTGGTWFLLEVPVFRDGPRHQSLVRLRNRVNEHGTSTWSFHLHEPRQAISRAFALLCGEVAKKTGIPVFRGVAERSS